MIIISEEVVLFHCIFMSRVGNAQCSLPLVKRTIKNDMRLNVEKGRVVFYILVEITY